MGKPGLRSGVYSIYRFGATPGRLLRRTLKLLNHEVGHIYGLRHCVFYECSMNASNSVAELDRHPIHYCPLDEAKLKSATGVSTADRYRRLAAYYRGHGLDADAEFLEAVLSHTPR